jgi:hypothetical protein
LLTSDTAKEVSEMNDTWKVTFIADRVSLTVTVTDAQTEREAIKHGLDTVWQERNISCDGWHVTAEPLG